MIFFFDWSQNLLQLGETIYDFDSKDYKEELQQHFNYEIKQKTLKAVSDCLSWF